MSRRRRFQRWTLACVAACFLFSFSIAPAGEPASADPAQAGTVSPQDAAPLAPSEEAAPVAFDEFGGFEEETGPAASTAPADVPFDPLRGFNRGMFHFNDRMYFWVLKPTARIYGRVIPKGVRQGIQRCFKNLGFPVRFVNNVLQGKMKGAGRETGRFLVNSTLGLGGFFDPARSWWGWEPSDEDFGQTLGRYGVGDGFPLVLPLIGPTNVRDALGMGADSFLNPLSYVDPHDPQFFNRTRLYIRAGEAVNRTSLDIGQYESIKKDALDPYTFIRDAYKQMRDQKIKE